MLASEIALSLRSDLRTIKKIVSNCEFFISVDVGWISFVSNPEVAISMDTTSISGNIDSHVAC